MNIKVNKSDFVSRMADHSGVSKADVQKVLAAFEKSVTEILEEGDSIALVGFGEFYSSLQKGKTGPVPGKPGQTYTTESKYVPKFKPGKKLKDSVAARK